MIAEGSSNVEVLNSLVEPVEPHEAGDLHDVLQSALCGAERHLG